MSLVCKIGWRAESEGKSIKDEKWGKERKRKRGRDREKDKERKRKLESWRGREKEPNI